MPVVGGHDLVVDRIDFKALLTAVEDGTVRSPELEAHLDPFRVVGQLRFG